MKMLCINVLMLFSFLIAQFGGHVVADEPRTHVSFKSAYSSLDPHKWVSSADLVIHHHLFDSLFTTNPDGTLGYDLVDAVEVLNDKAWRLTLKKDLSFHDGSALGAEDVLYSYQRLKSLYPDSQLDNYMKRIQTLKIIDQSTLEIVADRPLSLLGSVLQSLFIIPKTSPDYPAEEDFNNGNALIGTGAYQFDGFSDEGNLRLMVFDKHHEKERIGSIKKFEIRYFKSQEKRLAALLEGQIDMMDRLSAEEIFRLSKDGNFRFYEAPGDRLFHLYLDSQRAVSPFITDHSGKLLTVNPLRDNQVRKAMSLAIDREQLIDQAVDGLATPAFQLVKSGRMGYQPALDEKFDLEQAKSLMTEAGYKMGFRIDLHGPTDRYPETEKVLQQVADMWRTLNIDARVVLHPKRKYFKECATHQYSAGFMGFFHRGEIKGMLGSLLIRTSSDTPYFGAWNCGNYENAEVTTLFNKGVQEFSQALQVRYLEDAAELAIADTSLIPLYFPISTWGTRKPLVYWHDENNDHTFLWRLKPTKLD